MDIDLDKAAAAREIRVTVTYQLEAHIGTVPTVVQRAPASFVLPTWTREGMAHADE